MLSPADRGQGEDGAGRRSPRHGVCGGEAGGEGGGQDQRGRLQADQGRRRSDISS